MELTPCENFVYDIKLSSVVPASITGEDIIHELTNMDLMMKLHYIKGIYFFNSDAARGLSIHDFKQSLFTCLVLYYPVSGRIRVSESSGRPFIKCNDSGVRIVEAKCTKTITQWLEFNDSSLNDHLIYSQFLGPDLGYAPLVFVQFTWFKCGGISIGLSWAHVLGDAFSASHFINTWGQIMTGKVPYDHHSLGMPTRTGSGNNCNKSSSKPLMISSLLSKVPSSLQRVLLDSSGNNKWLISNRCKMQNHSFHITAKQLDHLMMNQSSKLMVKPFEVISAMIWKSLAKVRGKSSEPNVVTICIRNHAVDRLERETDQVLSSKSSQAMTICTVEAANLKVAIAEADLTDLAKLIAQEKVDETTSIEEVLMDQKDVDDGKSRDQDFILYGANLTFVNLEDLKVYGLELNGQKPVFASCTFSGIGDEGAVLVLPGPDGGKDDKEERGRMVNLILPENQLEDLKKELQKEWNIF